MGLLHSFIFNITRTETTEGRSLSPPIVQIKYSFCYVLRLACSTIIGGGYDIGETHFLLPEGFEQERNGGRRFRGWEICGEGSHSKGRKGSCPKPMVLSDFLGTVCGAYIRGEVAAQHSCLAGKGLGLGTPRNPYADISVCLVKDTEGSWSCSWWVDQKNSSGATFLVADTGSYRRVVG